MNGDFWKNVLKNALVWTVVGALFALLVPSIAAAVNIPLDSVSVMAKPQWLAPFLGGTAAMATALDPLCSYLLNGGKSPDADRAQVPEQPPVQVLVVREQDPAASKEARWQDWHAERTSTPPDPSRRLH